MASREAAQRNRRLTSSDALRVACRPGSRALWPGNHHGLTGLAIRDRPVDCAGTLLDLAVLPGGQVVTGGEDVRVWDPASSEANIVQLGCSAAALAAAPLDAHTSCLAIAHHGTGFSTWSVRM
jgi:hypothetical protein